MGNVFSSERLVETGEIIKNTAISTGIAVKDGVVATGEFSVAVAVATAKVVDIHVWQPTKVEIRKLWTTLDMKHSPGDQNMALFRSCLDGDLKLVQAALEKRKLLKYHWERRFVELTDEPAEVFKKEFPYAILKVIEEYKPQYSIDTGHDQLHLTAGSVVYGCLDPVTGQEQKSKRFWTGTLDPNSPRMLGEGFGIFPTRCVERLPLYRANWRRKVESGDGRTALHAAAYTGNWEIVELLMELGWDAWLKTATDPSVTCIDCARLGGNPKLAMHMYKTQPRPFGAAQE